MRLLTCFCLVGVTALFGVYVVQGASIWVANGVLLAYLLLAPRHLWPRYLAAGLLAHLAVAIIEHYSWFLGISFGLHGVLEAALAAYLLRRRSTELPNFTNAFYLLRFVACALLAAPLAVSLLTAFSSALWLHTPFSDKFYNLYVADCLGSLVTTPAFIAVLRSHISTSIRIRKDWLIIIPGVIAVSFLVLSHPRSAGPSILFPVLVFVLLRLGLGWAAFATLISAAIGAWHTSHGAGPYASISAAVLPAGVRLQLFIIEITAVLYCISVVIENLRSTERRLQQIANLHALVAENSRDVILLFDSDGKYTFIASPPDHLWGGWSREEIRKFRAFDLIHPDDRRQIAAQISEIRNQKEGALVETRIRRKDGTYAWIEANLRAVRDPISHIPTGILASLREVTTRKNAEQQLEDAFHAVEALSVTDPMTGLANRRRFDQSMAAEWRRSLREQKPLSLLLIDVDYFKRYNDLYGHPEGDTCLKRVAQAVRSGTARAGDLAARIGGEEFAVLLPNTSGKGARRLANRICEVMRSYGLVHASNPAGIVTVSVGYSTAVPQPGLFPSFLVDLADQSLYAAKRAGRNRAFPATTTTTEDEAQLAPLESSGLA